MDRIQDMSPYNICRVVKYLANTMSIHSYPFPNTNKQMVEICNNTINDGYENHMSSLPKTGLLFGTHCTRPMLVHVPVITHRQTSDVNMGILGDIELEAWIRTVGNGNARDQVQAMSINHFPSSLQVPLRYRYTIICNRQANTSPIENNGLVKRLSSDTKADWKGNILVMKDTMDGTIIDISPKDIYLIERIVLSNVCA